MICKNELLEKAIYDFTEILEEHKKLEYITAFNYIESCIDNFQKAVCNAIIFIESIVNDDDSLLIYLTKVECIKKSDFLKIRNELENSLKISEFDELVDLPCIIPENLQNLFPVFKDVDNSQVELLRASIFTKNS